MRTIAAILLFFTLVSACLALPVKTYLPVPYLCQAPYGNWGQPWQDGCEEAAIIMALKYATRDPEPVTREKAKQEILDLVAYQEKSCGGHYDLTAEQMAKLIKGYYGYGKVTVSYDVTIDSIKQELAQGHVVIAPMAGKLLHNPFYTPPGPAYHAMLFKGYDDRSGGFLTNDPGTRRGFNYRYKYQVAYNAIHDWTGDKSSIASGKKAIIIITR
ncbi:MAG: C39 family peptidase [Candidatus Saganbacteria bacterium]|nr:C39 family peptidase [Candidatus Saganbacteria bacterium]